MNRTRAVAGPASYPAGGFGVMIGELEKLVAAAVSPSGGYSPAVVGFSGNTASVGVYQSVGSVGPSGPHTEVPGGTDLSTVTFTVVGEGI